LIRERILREWCDLVATTMNLRPPQVEALRAVRDALLRLPRRLQDCTESEAREFLTVDDKWHQPAHPRFTVAMATGLGKTRLAGAIMAMLWLAGEARTFLILAPRRAVLRRIADGLDPTFREYIFVDPNLVPDPYVVRGDEIDGPRATDYDPDASPVIFLLSTQIICSSDRFLKKGEYAEQSAADALREQKGLVVIADEAHHIGPVSVADETKWAAAIRDLSPALEVGLTATPHPGTNLLYEYPLRRALAEGLYTKKPKLLVRELGGEWSDEDIDHATIDYALQRLEAKEATIAAVEIPPFPAVKPTAVLFARNIAHADELEEWILDTGRLERAELLKTHSGLAKSEEQLEELLTIERFENRVRVVLNVVELTEGWDVNNVYVVAPLRAMATFTGAIQSIGRGLRLPAGRRVEVDDADTLDVVCFGRVQFDRIVREATEWAGTPAPQGGGVDVRKFDDPVPRLGKVSVAIRSEINVPYATLVVRRTEMALDIQPEAMAGVTEAMVHAMDLAAARIRTGRAGGRVNLDRERFLDAATNRTLRKLSDRLSDVLHRKPVRNILEKWLDEVRPGEVSVAFDPIDVADAVARVLLDSAKAEVAEYEVAGTPLVLVAQAHELPVELRPDQPDASALSADDLPTLDRDLRNFVRHQPYRGCDGRPWQLCVYDAAAFESSDEAKTAILLDEAGDVIWWLRNDPKHIRIATPAGTISPDFIVRMRDGDKEGMLLLEVKGDLFWESPSSHIRLKARGSIRWAEAQTRAGEMAWTFLVAFESLVKRAATWAELAAMASAQPP
jgi:superfamily II DNA or RNA helicase